MNQDGCPSSRTVLLKEITPEGIIFYTNYDSHKSRDIRKNPNVAATFLWLGLERQVRIEGEASKVSKEISEAYFQSRPRDSQIGAWTSPQSEEIEKEKLARRFEEMEEKFSHHDNIPLPPNWGGFIVKPKTIEFWQGRPNRLHDRLKYELEDRAWKIKRLAP